MACHNLCSVLTPPPKLHALLGLGLNFCPRPTQPVKLTVVNDLVKRFKRDIHTKANGRPINSSSAPLGNQTPTNSHQNSVPVLLILCAAIELHLLNAV
jgi:hypothetical protein